MIINKIILENFRIFNNKHIFDFNTSNLIILSGPNGNGKSTIIDSINWCLTGKIERYVGDIEYKEFEYIVNNKSIDRGEKIASVYIEFRDGNDIFTVERSIKNKETKLLINNIDYGVRKGQEKINKVILFEDDNMNKIYDLSTYLSTSTILSQETLNTFIRNDGPSDRFLKVEKILGLEKVGNDFKKYINEVKKTMMSENEKLIQNKNKEESDLELLKVKYDYGKKTKIEEEELRLLESKIKNLLDLGYLDIDKFNVMNIYSKENLKIMEDFNKNLLSRIEKLKYYYNILEEEELLDESKNSIENKIEVFNKRKKDLKADKKEILEENVKLKNEKLELQNILEKIVELYKLGMEIDNLKLEKDKNKLYRNYDLKVFFKEYEEIKNELLNIEYLIEYKSIESKINDNKKEMKSNNLISHYNKKNIQNLYDCCDTLVKNKEELLKNQISSMDDNIKIEIYNLQELLIVNKSNNCIICGTEFIDHNHLEDKINNYRRISKTKLNNLEKNLSEIDLEIKNKQKDIKILRNDNEIIDTKLLDLQANFDILNKKKIELISKINDTNIYNEKINVSKEQLVDLKENLSNQIKDKETLYQISILYNEIYNKINSIKNELNINKLNSIGVKNKKDEYEQDLYELSKKLDYNQQLIKKINKEIDEINKYILRNKIFDNIFIDMEIENLDIKLSFFIKEKISSIESQYKYINDTHSILSNRIAVNETNNIYKKMEILSKNICDLEMKIYKLDKLLEELENLSNNHDRIQTNMINKYINKLNNNINGFYKQICPHAYYEDIEIEIKDKKLYIMLKDESNTKSNASLSLSAGQGVILSMSIFLALNIGINPKLKLLAIDDPFQSLDDINTYSFIDVLEKMIMETDRQIIISTHEIEFKNLLISKLNSNKINVMEVDFKTYSRNEVRYEIYNS